MFLWGFPGGSDGRESACWETWVWSLGWEDPLEKGMATHSNTLAWRTPWTQEPSGLQSMGSQRIRHGYFLYLLSNWASSGLNSSSAKLHVFRLSSVLGNGATKWKEMQFSSTLFFLIPQSKPYLFYFLQFSSVAQSCPTLCDPMNRSTPGLPVHHQLPEFTQTHVHPVYFLNEY